MNVDIPDYAVDFQHKRLEICFPKHEYMIHYEMNLVFKLQGLQRKYSCYHFGLLSNLVQSSLYVVTALMWNH